MQIVSFVKLLKAVVAVVAIAAVDNVVFVVAFLVLYLLRFFCSCALWVASKQFFSTKEDAVAFIADPFSCGQDSCSRPCKYCSIYLNWLMRYG